MPAPTASPARRTAHRVLLRYGRGRRHLSDVLRADTGYDQLDERDAALAHELAYGVVRRLATLDAVLQTFADPPLARVEPAALWALRLGAYQLLFLDRVPVHAAVSDSVALLRGRHAAGFVNAVLRHVSAGGDERLAVLTEGGGDEAAAFRFSVPVWLVERWRTEWGRERSERLLAALDEPAERCVRVNRLRASVDDAVIALADAGVTALAADGDSRWPDALVVSGGRIERTAPFRAGLVTPQSRGSQLVCQSAAGRVEARRIIDMCAAPGIKTTQLAALFPGADILAVDVDGERAAEITEIAARLHAHGIEVRVHDARHLERSFDGTADLVLLDAPCTGLGTAGLQPDLRWRVRPEDVPRLARVQRALLDRATRLLRPGGLLVYSVCTMTSEETVQVVGHGTTAGNLAQDDLGSLFPSLRDPRQGGSLLVMPDEQRTTGFFIAHLRRAG